MAGKKGGGFNLRQNLVWIVIIGVLGILAYFTLANGNNGKGLSTGGGSVAGDTSSKKIASPKTAAGGGGDTNTATAPAGYNLSAKNGGSLGGSYLLKNLSMSKGTGYESANIFLKSLSGSAGVPKYGVSISGSTIIVTLSDTKNYDIDAGGTSYSGANPLAVNGSVIKSIEYVQNGEDSMRINISLKKQAAFDDKVLANPPTLEVRVAI